ncbi:hypothetical protein HOG48_05250 [Candidatus Peregrinibacteria bacterium]|jgi:hypothetical protein|nr:hypothetical protein [Candidatus Peregrinibacteria bacterium]
MSGDGKPGEDVVSTVEAGNEVVEQSDEAEVALEDVVVPEKLGEEVKEVREAVNDSLDGTEGVEAAVETAEQIAARWAETIPEEDRRLTEPVQISKLLSLLTDSGCSNALDSGDKLGNLPTSIKQAARAGDKEETVKLMRQFAEDPHAFIEETDKISEIGGRSNLPSSVQKALASIVLNEGSRPATVLFADVADAIEAEVTGEEDAPSILDAFGPIKKRAQTEDKGNDRLRYNAVKAFAAEVYPDLVAAPEMQLINEILDLDYDSRSDVSIVGLIASRCAAMGVVMDDDEYAEYNSEAALQEGLDSRELRPYQVMSVLGEWQDALESHFVNRLVQPE